VSKIGGRIKRRSKRKSSGRDNATQRVAAYWYRRFGVLDGRRIYIYQRNVDVAESAKRYRSVLESCQADENVFEATSRGRYHSGRNCFTEATDAMVAANSRAFDEDRFIAAYELALLPVVLFWLSILPVIRIVCWVRKGFDDGNAH
jgi:hypothetical protein